MLIAEAYQILESERCSQCGYPRWICHNDDGDIGVDVTEDICYVKRELENVDREKTSQKGYVAPAGVKAAPKVHRFSGKPFDWKMREDYYLAEYKKRQPES